MSRGEEHLHKIVASRRFLGKRKPQLGSLVRSKKFRISQNTPSKMKAIYEDIRACLLPDDNGATSKWIIVEYPWNSTPQVNGSFFTS